MRKKINFVFLIFFLFNSIDLPGQDRDLKQLCKSQDKAAQAFDLNQLREADSLYRITSETAINLSQWEDWITSSIELYKVHKKSGKSFKSLSEFFYTFHNKIQEAPSDNQARFYSFHAYIQNQLGRISDCIGMQKKAYTHYKATKNYKKTVSTLRSLVISYSFYNDHKSAVLFAEKYISAISESDKHERRRAFSLMANVQIYNEDLHAARSALDSLISYESSRSIGSLQIEATLLSLEGEFNKAKNTLDIVSKLLQANSDKTPPSDWQYFYSLKADVLDLKKDYLAANKLREKSLNILSSTKDQRTYAKNLQKSASAQFHLKDFDGSLKSSHKVLQILCRDFNNPSIFSAPDSSQIVPESWLMEALYNKAKALQALQIDKEHTELINQSFERAIYCLDLLRQSYLVDQSKYQMTKTMTSLFGDAFKYNVDLYKSTNNLEHLNRAFQYSQLKKAFVLKSSRSIRNIFQLLQIPEITASSYFELLAQKSKNKSIRVDLLDSIQVLEAKLIRDYPTLKRRLPSSPILLKDVKKHLYPNQAYLHYALNENMIHCFLVQPDTIQLISWDKPPDFIPNISNYYKSCRDLNFIASKSAEAQKLFLNSSWNIYNSVFKKAHDKISSKIDLLSIESEGILNQLVFDNLLVKPAKNWSNYQDMLISKYAINYLFHTDQILRQSNESKLYETSICVAIDYKDKSSHIENDLKNLSYTHDEINTVSKEINGTSLTKNISKKEITKQLKKADIFHFAGHAISSTDKIEENHLALSNLSGFKREYLSYSDITALNLSNQLVTLSACSTNDGENIKSEGVLSLSRAFIESGTLSTLGSNWNTPDKISNQILSIFYKNINSGMNKAEALRAAKINYLSNDELSSPSQRAPIFWSNWMIYGDISPLKRQNRNYPFLIFCGIFLLSIFYFSYSKK